MGKDKKLAVVVANTQVEAPADNTTKAAVVAASTGKAEGTIKVLKSSMPYRGARAQWYATLKDHDGKPYAEWLAAVTAKRPSVYGPKSVHAGKPEPIPGWVGFFVRNKIVQITK